MVFSSLGQIHVSASTLSLAEEILASMETISKLGPPGAGFITPGLTKREVRI